MVFENDPKCKATEIAKMLDSGLGVEANSRIQECSNKLYADTWDNKLSWHSPREKNASYLEDVYRHDQSGVGADIGLVYKRWTPLLQFPPRVSEYYIWKNK